MLPLAPVQIAAVARRKQKLTALQELRSSQRPSSLVGLLSSLATLIRRRLQIGAADKK